MVEAATGIKISLSSFPSAFFAVTSHWTQMALAPASSMSRGTDCRKSSWCGLRSSSGYSSSSPPGPRVFRGVLSGATGIGAGRATAGMYGDPGIRLRFARADMPNMSRGSVDPLCARTGGVGSGGSAGQRRLPTSGVRTAGMKTLTWTAR